MRRLGISVALIGPDGVGKSTVTRALATTLANVRYLYMGVNLETSRLMLPTTRLILIAKQRAGGRPDLVGWPSPGSDGQQSQAMWRAWIRIGNLILEEWFRATVSWYHRARGRIVLMDRHFLADYWKHDMDPTDTSRTLISKIHGGLLRRLYPRPDLVILLDLDPHESFRRKPEGNLADRIARHREYRDLDKLFPRLVRIDASMPVQDVIDACADAIEDARAERRVGTSRNDSAATR